MLYDSCDFRLLSENGRKVVQVVCVFLEYLGDYITFLDWYRDVIDWIDNGTTAPKVAKPELIILSEKLCR